jgi:hypothetical protein
MSLRTRGKPLRFSRTDSNCYVCVSHRTNPDGYLRLQFNGVMAMFHRVMWEEKHGKIPPGHEIHHKCGVRPCCNVEHLEIIDGREHAILTNKERYLDRKGSVLHSASTMSVKELAETYDCSERTVYRYLRG